MKQLESETVLPGARAIDEVGKAGPLKPRTGTVGLVWLLVAVLVAFLGAAWMLVQNSS